MHRAMLLGVVLVVGLCLPGCGSRVSKANADKITTGMTEKEVLAILGEPTETWEHEAGAPDIPGFPAMPKTPGMKVKRVTWKEGKKSIVVGFMNGKVFMKQATF